MLPEGKRNTAFGLFYIGYGGGWLIGSVTTGLLYEHGHVFWMGIGRPWNSPVKT